MQFWVSLNELCFRVGVLGSTEMQSAFTGCYSEPGMWLPFVPLRNYLFRNIVVLKGEKYKERDQNLILQVMQINSLILDTNINHLAFDVRNS